jgi:hypothetical protein
MKQAADWDGLTAARPNRFDLLLSACVVSLAAVIASKPSYETISRHSDFEGFQRLS